MTQISFALAQIDTCVGDVQGNARAILRSAMQAHQAHHMHQAHATSASTSALVIAFPEMTMTGYPIEDLAYRQSLRDEAAQAVAQLASDLAEHGLGEDYVVVGTIGFDKLTQTLRNRLVVLHQGAVLLHYDKHFLPNYGVFDEYRIFAPGDQSAVLSIDGARIGLAICEDIWQEGGTLASLAKQGVDALLVINGSPYEAGKITTRVELAQRRAQQLHAPVIYVNQVGGQDDLVFDGGSFAVDSDGTLLARAPMFDESVCFVALDTAQQHQRAGVITPLPSLEAQVYSACVLGLRDYMRKNHFAACVLGLSGGIDSALVATMAADAVGGEQVWGISMPSMYSSDGSKDDAWQLAQHLGAHYEVQPIEHLYHDFASQLHLEGIAAENVQARIRGVIVMGYANSFNLIALATGNKSELACGYSTIYGDAVGGFAPLKDVFKTQVWQLAKWRNAVAERGLTLGALPLAQWGAEDAASTANNAHSVVHDAIHGDSSMRQQVQHAALTSDELAALMALPWETLVETPQIAEVASNAQALQEGILIPVSSITKAPSAELRPGQKDADSLPEYALLDEVLAAYIEHSLDRQQLIAQGFDAHIVDMVMRLVDRAEWKRRQYPLGPKVSALAFGRDRRLPVTQALRQ